MRIALAGTSTYDVHDPRSWSGVPHSIYRALQRRDDVEVVGMGPTRYPRRIPEAIRKGAYAAVGRRYFWEREPRILRHYRAQFAAMFDELQPDAVVAFCSLTAGALPDWIRPVLYTDTTWRGNLDYYETWTGLCRRSRRQGEATEVYSLEHAAQVVVSSEWCARSVIEDYGYPAEQVLIHPMGAGNVSPWGPAELEPHIESRLDGPMRLLWMGAEWRRKGGEISLEVARELHRRGVPVELHLVGRYPDEVASEPFVESHGTLVRATHGELIDRLFADSFALLLPTRAENTSIVLADAASYALPSLASNTGGTPAMVVDEVNGLLMDYDASPAAYADALLALQADPDRYRHLCRTSRTRYETELNWDATAEVLVEACHRAISADRPIDRWS